MRIEHLVDRLRAVAPRAEHRERVLRLWVQAHPQDHGRRRLETFLPASLRAALPALTAELSAIARIESEHPDGEGASRLLLRLADGNAVESVLLPRGGLCVSTQVGC
ncbi:MAG TPA: hypothetical protein VMT74_10670, partial [Gaiellaceae bacterium]|nr:hypothetical protein [Gaiellaceae bacterium]